MLSKTIIKYIQSLVDKKVRDSAGVFVAEGPKVVEELLLSGKFRSQKILALPEWFYKNNDLVKNITEDNCTEITDIELERISALQTPKQVLAVFYKKELGRVELTDSISLMLDGIQDPGNLGTIIRTADWFGVKNIICSIECADCYNSKVVQSTMGSLARVNVIYIDLLNFLRQNNSIEIYTATLSGRSIYKIKKIVEGIIVIGNESKGISQEILKLAAQKITIPKIGNAESLNAAVATGIILSEIIR